MALRIRRWRNRLPGELPAETQVASLRVLQERELIWRRSCVKKTHKIADVGGLQGRPWYAQLLCAINHAGAMAPESGGEGNSGESFGVRSKPGPILCAFRHVTMASSTTALGKNALSDQRGSGGLEVPQAREKR